jgi:hypothetical protein
MKSALFSWHGWQENPMNTVYVWHVELDGESFIVLALADSPEAGVRQILAKFSQGGMSPERLLLSENALQSSTPAVMDFAGGVGMLSVHPS